MAHFFNPTLRIGQLTVGAPVTLYQVARIFVVTSRKMLTFSPNRTDQPIHPCRGVKAASISADGEIHHVRQMMTRCPTDMHLTLSWWRLRRKPTLFKRPPLPLPRPAGLPVVSEVKLMLGRAERELPHTRLQWEVKSSEPFPEEGRGDRQTWRRRITERFAASLRRTAGGRRATPLPFGFVTAHAGY